ncbi:DegT/DnrJ/EryC1/StrS family aminotransferase [Hymenobacter sp. DG25A]|uniref:DegT/DnrJ/EryC1/StrS family aminotransferase n=1 Tax=Hymenobacter sp. DG25A TaxID=1385663 RepID=UPI0006BC1786|nr:DegT/DnrJ/EryC1/StrS family aminotransferase [Hymenobacter sp. DG25A]ALD21446.1 aminotransferase [Hymenobacter sp. DG25A]
MPVPFLSFVAQNERIRADVQAATMRVFDSQQYILAEEVRQFEAEYAAFNQVPHCVGVSSGLSALHLALVALGIGPGDEVLVPSNSYVATWLAVSYVGATLVPVEPDEATFNLDAQQLEAAITPRTRAILPVHFFGQACNMAAIMEVARQHDLIVIEDNAQAQGAASHGQLTGSFGEANATSFYPTKNLGALGDAGAITTKNAALAEQLKVLRNYGSRQKYQNEVIGYNARLDELQAAILRVKLPYLSLWTQQHQQLAAWYDTYLAAIPGLQLPQRLPTSTHVYHLYVVRTPNRDALQRHLTAHGIGTVIHYPVPPHLQPAYQDLGFIAGQFPIAEHLAATSLSLPLWPGMQEAQVAEVAECIRRFTPA